MIQNAIFVSRNEEGTNMTLFGDFGGGFRIIEGVDGTVEAVDDGGGEGDGSEGREGLFKGEGYGLVHPFHGGFNEMAQGGDLCGKIDGIVGGEQAGMPLASIGSENAVGEGVVVAYLATAGSFW